MICMRYYFDTFSNNKFSRCTGLKYEVAISIHTQEVMWIRGPLPCSVHDISMFRGGTKEDKKKNKIDKDAFIFQIPDGKRGVGDSGCK